MVRALRLWPLAALLAALLVAGCQDKPVNVRMDGNILAALDINPDNNGRPSPTVVRVYQLKSADAFQKADFFSLFDQEKSLLGENLIAREEMDLRPGEKREFKRDMKPETRYVGVVAAFRRINDARWRSIVRIPEKVKSVNLAIKLTRLGVSVGIAGQ